MASVTNLGRLHFCQLAYVQATVVPNHCARTNMFPNKNFWWNGRNGPFHYLEEQFYKHFLAPIEGLKESS